MKTAISIPDELFAAAEKLAKKEKVSRSDLYARAIANYIAVAKREDITRKMSEALKYIDQTPDPAWEEARRQALLRSELK